MSSKNKHMTLQDRIEIQECLSKGMTFKAIGQRIGKDQTTVSKEVKLQKPHVEKNHTLFRDIVPKGHSFDDFTQETVDLIFSHVNAVKRKQFNGKSSYDLFTFSYSEKLASLFGISYIPPEKVCQSPSLIK